MRANMARSFQSGMDQTLVSDLRSTGADVIDLTGPFAAMQNSQGASLAIAVTVEYLRLDVYNPLAGNYAIAGIAIRFQVFDPQAQQVVFDRRYSESATSHDGPPPMHRAFAQALLDCLNEPAFQSVLTAKQKSKTPAESLSTVAATQVIEIAKADMRVGAIAANPFQTNVAAVFSLSGDKGLGTGFVISRQGLALSNAHVVKGQSSLKATFRGGTSCAADVVRLNEQADVALLQLPRGQYNPVLLDLTKSFDVGDEVMAIGTPLSQELSFSATRGIVSGLRFAGDVSMIQTDATVNPGNSGGPLIEVSTHSVVGIVSEKIVGQSVEGIAFAIDIRDALRTVGVKLQP